MHSPRVAALDDLQFIRDTMASAAPFTAFSGAGIVTVGVSALAASAAAWKVPLGTRWTALWLLEAAVAVSIGWISMQRKASRSGAPLWSGPGKKFAWGFLPPMVAGAILTLFLARFSHFWLLPGVWMLLYGAAVITSGAVSVRVVPAMGACFMMCGAATLVWPATIPWMMAISFGGLHIAYGLVIANRYGG